ncbi:hypothetical protein PG985_005254 [Apiospora marii]|uniref:uncharacterized protein n=1 Tax=Apiospora marii TaxID=335849 RepID=UPI00312D0946
MTASKLNLGLAFGGRPATLASFPSGTLLLLRNGVESNGKCRQNMLRCRPPSPDGRAPVAPYSECYDAPYVVLVASLQLFFVFSIRQPRAMCDISDAGEGEWAGNEIYQLIKEDNVVGVREHLTAHPDIKTWILVRPDGRIHNAAIQFAASVGSLGVLQILMAAAGETDWAPSLYRACRNGQVEAARWILDNRIDAAAESLSSAGPHGSLLLNTLESFPPHLLEVCPEAKTPGHLWHARREEVVHLLLDRGANIHDKRCYSNKRFNDNVELLNPGWDLGSDYTDQEALDILLARDGNNQDFNGEWGDPSWEMPRQSMELEEPTSTEVLLEPMEPIVDTALTLALSFASGDLISRLIEGGCDIYKDVTPLHLACHYKNIAGVRSLLQAGGSKAKSMIAARDSNGMTPFHWATLGTALYYPQGDVWEARDITTSDKMKACLELILACDSSQLDVQDRWGRTALHYASLLESADVATFLVNNKADPNVKDEEGRTPLLTLLSRSYMPSLVNRHVSPADLDLFLRHGAELHEVDANGNTLLHLASRSWRWKNLVQWLLQHGVPAGITNNEKKLPLHNAAKCIHESSDEYGDTFVRFDNALRAQDEMMGMLTGTGDLDRPDATGTTPRQALAACRARAHESIGRATSNRLFEECSALERRQFRLGYQTLPAAIRKMMADQTTTRRLGRVNTHLLGHHVSIGRGDASLTRGTGRVELTLDHGPWRNARPRGRSLEGGGSLYI